MNSLAKKINRKKVKYFNTTKNKKNLSIYDGLGVCEKTLKAFNERNLPQVMHCAQQG